MDIIVIDADIEIIRRLAAGYTRAGNIQTIDDAIDKREMAEAMASAKGGVLIITCEADLTEGAASLLEKPEGDEPELVILQADEDDE